MVNFYKEGTMKNIVPLMLCISLVSSCMYVYSKEYLALFIFITVILQTTVFSFYTYLSRKSMLLKFISILGSFFAIGALVAIAVRTGNNKSSIDYFIWFLSPQALVEFSMPYIVATFIVINFFIASTVYYFSAVRYRISMTFLITLIPFAVYRKETAAVPVGFALLLLIMYIALMIHCRQVNLKSRQKMIMDRGYKKSVVLFLAVSSLLALAIPKPDVKVDNSWVDNAFESERITEYMLNKLGIVSDTASSSVNYTSTMNVKLFEFSAEETPINLKSQTYSLYNFDNNRWKTIDSEKRGNDFSESYAELLNPAEFYKAVAMGVSLDSDFADKYELKKLKPELSGDYEHFIKLISARIPAIYYFTPVLAYSVSSANDQQVFRSQHGMLYSENPTKDNYIVKYYSDSSLNDKNMLEMVNSMSSSTFGEFLEDLGNVLSDNKIYDYDDVIEAYTADYESAMLYYEESMTEIPESFYETAEKTVKKKKSDLEKAQAIESYFRLNDFVYSLTYTKPKDYNMEYFLTEGKTGICSDYATAMVLLARAAGIPARYAEGVHLHDPDEEGVISVTDSDLHAFPELYIAGYGWKSFEPTQLDVVETGSSFDVRMSVFLAMTAVFIILFILFYDRFIYPYFSEKIFSLRLKNAENEKSVEMVIIRLRKKLGLSESVTVAEMAEIVSETYGIDMKNTADSFDRVVYGAGTADESEKSGAAELYSLIKGRIDEENRKNKNRQALV